MKRTMIRAGLAALLSLALVSARADYVGTQAGGAGNITYGAFAPTLNGVVTQLTKSVPVDPVTGTAIFTSVGPGYVSIVGTPAVTVAGVATAANQATGNTALASILTAVQAPIPAGTNQIGAVETVVRSTSTNRGGLLATAGTAQTLVPANAARRGLAVQNRNAPGASYSAATSVFMSCLATATQDFNSLEIPAGALYETPSHHAGTGACSFVSGTASTPVYVREF